ncbi:6603_t:CDS:2 [Dentiscutata erythropus]|uniref:6603_t:CDS:1 n=1 Tax=Dentiscutata erythropus TaxID=1348616 RepID=A0A9N9DUN2_9GLOM|nr:6603_t:CDS:2 [Dentiscutata erythropus]
MISYVLVIKMGLITEITLIAIITTICYISSFSLFTETDRRSG